VASHKVAIRLRAWLQLFFVTRQIADKVIDACPDNQWKLLFALCRYGGLRCPSEVLALKWSDIDWERNRIRVPSPKTEHIEGKESRMIPMFPELRPLLLDVLDEAEEGGSEYVITRYRDSNVNLRTQLKRIIARAGITPWPKLFQNLRSTRETELAEEYPLHVVCSWIGNSLSVAKEHYLQITDLHFLQAAQMPPETSAEKAAQNPAQSEAVSTHPTSSSDGDVAENDADLLVGTTADDSSRNENHPRQDSNL
jgi:hypothetical protein